MALVSELASAIADVEGIPQKSMDVIVRHARESGFISTGARGRNAPPATVSDAVNIILAANAGGPVLIATPVAIPLYRRLETLGGYRSARFTDIGKEYLKIEDSFLHFLAEPTSFGEALENIVERFVAVAVDHSLETYLTGLAGDLSGLNDTIRSIRAVDDKAVSQLGDAWQRTKEHLDSGFNVRFEVTFFRPMPSASIFVIKGNDILAQVDFTLANRDLRALAKSGSVNAWSKIGRKESVTIDYRVFSRIGDILRGDHEIDGDRK